MEDIFKPQSLTIKQLFGNTDALYQIPRYQRPYSWTDDQLEKLWSDLIEAKETEPNYFLGSVITAKPEEKSNYLDIVDGQQRLTTLTILLCVYRDLYPEINKDQDDPFSVDARVIESSIRFNDRFERLRLKTHSNHQSDFENIILSGNTITCRKPYKKDINKQEEPKFKFLNSANFFFNKLEEIGEEDAGVLINYIFNQVKIIRIDCQSVSFAIKLFQVLNDRGLDLSNADLIKSFLIGKIHKKYASEEELKRQKEDQFMDDWKVCETIATDTEYSMNDFFVMYEYHLLGANPERSLYDELVKQFEHEDSNKIVSDFKAFCNHYKNGIYNKEDKTIYSFWYLRWSVYWRTILTTALYTEYDGYDELCKHLLRYYYLHWIAGNTLSRIKQLSFNVIKWIKDKRSVSQIIQELEDHLNSTNTVERAIENLNGDIYFEQWCKPILFLIEYKQTDNSTFAFLNMGDRNIHIEHIIPKAFELNPDWQMFHEDSDIDYWINSGANLTLLSGTKNISASNSGIENKINAYNGKGFYGSNEEGITSFQITQRIVHEHSRNSEGGWNWKKIENRWHWFCDEVGSILNIDLSKIKEIEAELQQLKNSN